MNITIHSWISLTRLNKTRIGGQIATLLILMMVVVLILILITVNLGQLSLEATTLSNAADSAVLSLGSALSTKANMLFHALSDKSELCKKGGLLGVILAIIVVIIVLILCQGACSPLVPMIWGAIAGGVGNYIVTGR